MFYRAKILSYNAQNRTANVHIIGLTDGAEDGLTATFAYAVGDDDRDTELKIVAGNDCYVFFESNDPARPVIAFYASHGTGALTDIRRIKQQNIELLAEVKATIEAPNIALTGNVTLDGLQYITKSLSIATGATGTFSNFLGQTLTISDGIVINIV